jgi:hypothetical protein
MVYGRVTDVTNIEELSASQLPATLEDCVIEDDIVIVDTVPVNLLLPNKIEDSPEIFKRVRFITRWEDFEESRGPLIWISGGVSCWGTAVKGPAWYPVKQIKSAAAAALRVTLSDNFRESGFWAAVNIFFIGSSRQDSKPVFTIYTNSDIWRQAFFRVARKWLRSNNIHLPIVSSTGGLFKPSAERAREMKTGKNELIGLQFALGALQQIIEINKRLRVFE